MPPSIGITRYTIGILALLSVVCIWVSSSFLMNNIFAGQNYNKPFFVTYVNTASFSLYLLGPFFRQWRDACSYFWTELRRRSTAALAVEKKDTKSAVVESSNDTIQPSRSYGSVSQAGSTITATSPSSGTGMPQSDAASTLEEGRSLSSEQDDQPLSHREIAELSFAFCILWFAANWATNASLAYTTVASSTILASMSGFFTLAIGAMLKTESFSTLKLIAVCASVAGVALVSESDRSESPMNDDVLLMLDPKAPIAPLFGDFLALMSAMFYGCYTVLLKVKIQNESRVNMPLFFGFVGLFNLVLLWPMFGVLHWTGIEPFELPADTKVIWMIGINALVGTFVSDYLWLLSMLMTSPLVVTLGLSLTIPLALLGDVVGYGRVLGAAYWVGAGLVLAGFFGVNGVALSERDEADREEEVVIRSAASCPTAAVAASALVEERHDRAITDADERVHLLRPTSSR
ncbi:hypothetical protein BGX29_000946 [Mortierella sp. GBA35]|nr:hypothetical protein BGX23_006605 [Mortierella sp. AD031]KAF9104972.1 hypothetical protein BGX29_000946 [Mortierella sp. GBA35]KAG0212805.1 hypothetical protein BGX33_003363 [Mortierella sp. NVP41]